jgi:hypothetical protein
MSPSSAPRPLVVSRVPAVLSPNAPQNALRSAPGHAAADLAGKTRNRHRASVGCRLIAACADLRAILEVVRAERVAAAGPARKLGRRPACFSLSEPASAPRWQLRNTPRTSHGRRDIVGRQVQLGFSCSQRDIPSLVCSASWIAELLRQCCSSFSRACHAESPLLNYIFTCPPVIPIDPYKAVRYCHLVA